ncbi:MAG: PD-(D/E)XK nuclease family protein [Oscillospiraceae bacterium]
MLYHPARDLILKADRDITPEALRRAMDRELRRDGMVLGDPEVLRAMEHSALEAPCFLPIQVSKDGGISGGVATAAQLGRLGQYVEKLLHQIIRELRQGNIDADPCWRGPQESACTYCDFASICHFQDGGRRPVEGCATETGEGRRVLGICSA